MGMFDSFFSRFPCPNCGYEAVHEVQTKELDCRLNAYRPGDIVRDAENLNWVDHGIFWCNKCDHTIRNVRISFFPGGIFAGVGFPHRRESDDDDVV